MSASVFAVDAEMFVHGEDGGAVVEFGETDQASIGERHGSLEKFGVLGHEVGNSWPFCVETECDSDGITFEQGKEAVKREPATLQ